MEFNFQMDSYAARVVLQRTYLSNTTITVVCTDVIDKVDLTLVNFRLIYSIHNIHYLSLYNTQPVTFLLMALLAKLCGIWTLFICSRIQNYYKLLFIKLLFIFIHNPQVSPFFSSIYALFQKLDEVYKATSHCCSTALCFEASCAIDHLIRSLQLSGTEPRTSRAHSL